MFVLMWVWVGWEAGKQRSHGEVKAALCSGDGQGKNNSDFPWKSPFQVEVNPLSDLGALEIQKYSEARWKPFS